MNDKIRVSAIIALLMLCANAVFGSTNCTQACYEHRDMYCRISYNGHKAECHKCRSVCQSERTEDRWQCEKSCRTSQFYPTTTPKWPPSDASPQDSSPGTPTTASGDAKPSSQYLPVNDPQPPSTSTSPGTEKQKLVANFISLIWKLFIGLGTSLLVFIMCNIKDWLCGAQRTADDAKKQIKKETSNGCDGVANQPMLRDTVVELPGNGQGSGIPKSQTAVPQVRVIAQPTDSGQELEMDEIPKEVHAKGTATTGVAGTSSVSPLDKGKGKMALGVDPAKNLAAETDTGPTYEAASGTVQS